MAKMAKEREPDLCVTSIAQPSSYNESNIYIGDYNRTS